MCRSMEDLYIRGWCVGFLEGFQEKYEQERGLKEGEGYKQAQIACAECMLEDGRLSPERVAGYSGLPLEEVLKLQTA